jgi:Phage Tail Collar Domain
LPQLRPVLALLGALAALAVPAAALGSANMYMGAAEDEGRNADPQVAMAKMQLAKAAGFDTIRVTATWSPGQSAVPADQLQALQSIAAAGIFLDIRIVATVMPFGSRATPLTAAARTQFARFAANLVRKVPTIREYIVGNEPNLNRYWLPQFGANGEDVAAAAYVQLLARTYDLMKAADPNVFINGGSVSPRGIDRPGTGRDTHSPTAFITDMGIAYRAMNRNKPIMDGFSFHPYGENSSTPPTLVHTSGTSLGLADYPKLVSLLGTAFNGTAQKGFTLPIVYDEYGVDSQIPMTKRSFYGGTEPATTKPVSEGVQAAYYDEALKLAACQPTVRGFLIFHVTDETDYNRWQSGVYYADGTPKSSRALVKAAMSAVRAGAYECGDPPITDETFGWVLIAHSH